MKKLTNEERIEILKTAKTLIKEGYYTFICIVLYNLMMNVRKSTIFPKECEKVFRVFPEMLKYKPKSAAKDGAWWNGIQRVIRVRTINNMIKDIKSQIK